MTMDADDSSQLLDQVGRFSKERIAQVTSKPDSPIAPDILAQLTQEACDLGILPQSTSGEGYSIWEHTSDPEAMLFNTGALRQIACTNAGIAFTWHRFALARFVAHQLGLVLDARALQGTLLAPTGHYGLARISLAKWLKKVPLNTEDVALLSDWLDRNTKTSSLCAPDYWSTLLWPVWIDGCIGWQHVKRADLSVKILKPLHGFDELRGFAVHQSALTEESIQLDPEASRILYERMLKIEMLGLLAIGAGVLDHGQQLARDFSMLRKQGGKLIAGHSAVQHMLSDIEITHHNIDIALAAFSKPLDALDLGALAATRASMSVALCQATNQVIQVHGGIGYMRDVGPEKLVRDQNMLKMLSGGTRDIHSFLAGWTGAYA